MNIITFLDAMTLGDDMDTGVFTELGKFTAYPYTNKDDTIERITDANVIITNKVILNSDNLKFAKDLKLIALTATGYNNVDLDYCKANNIAVANVAGYSTESVAQLTFSMLFYLMNHMPYYDSYVKSGEYSKSPIYSNFSVPWHELAGQQWGIIGFGEIGKSVASKALSFGCKVKYYSTTGKNNDPNFECVSLDDLLKHSDIVSIHSPLNKYTEGLIGKKELSLMKKSSILLNMGRGGIVDEAALADAINNSCIFASGTDVLTKEPISADNALLKIKDKSKILIMPHLGWASVEARTRLIDEVYENIIAFFGNSQRNRIV